MVVRFRYSLRTFVIVVLSFATALGLWAHRSRKQARLVRAAEFAKFRIEYESLIPARLGVLSKWLTQVSSILGKDWYSIPVAAQNAGAGEHLEDFHDLCALRPLRSVNLGGSPAGDDAIRVLVQLKQLQVLKLEATLITDAGLALLNKHPQLAELDVNSTLVSPAAVDRFRKTNPDCNVTYHRSIDPEWAEQTRHWALQANRVPTPEERRKLDLAAKIIATRDKTELYELGEQLWPGPPLNPRGRGGLEGQRKEKIRAVYPDRYHKMAAVLLGQMGLAAGVPHIERAARDISLSEWERGEIVMSLGQIADRSVIPILIDLLDDPNSHVAGEACRRLMQLTGSPLGPLPVGFSEPESESRRYLSRRWREFWKENGHLIRPRRAPTFNPHWDGKW